MCAEKLPDGREAEHPPAPPGSPLGRAQRFVAEHQAFLDSAQEGELQRRVQAELQRLDSLTHEELARVTRALDEEVEFRRAAEESLRQRFEIEHMVAEISKRFISLPFEQFDAEITQTLGAVCEFVKADRAYLFQLRAGGTLKDNTHEWCAPGIARVISKLQGLPVSDFPLWMVPLQRLEYVAIPRVADMPEEARGEREHLESQGIQSLLLVPMAWQGTMIAFLGFDAVRSERHWLGPDTILLRMVGDVLASALQRRRADQALRDAEDRLRQAQKLEAVGRLAGGIAHDFNNLLAVIRANAELALEELPSDHALRAALADIGMAAQRGAYLTSQLLAFGRRQVLAPQVLDLNDVVRSIESMLHRLLGEHVELVTELAPAALPVLADVRQLELVVINLVINARDAMPEGGTVRIGTALVAPLGARPERGAPAVVRAKLSVSDDGVGMDQATMERALEPFFTTKETGVGTGLGLSTVHGIVTQGGGELQVASAPGRGSTFTVLWPVASQSVAAARISDHPTAAEQTGGETILIVEDEEQVRKLTCRILRSRGYRVLDACDGRHALELAAEYDGPIHLLLSDVVMPGIQGPAVYRALRALRPAVRVLYMSGHCYDVVHGLGGLRSEQELIQKPFASAMLAKRVREILDAGAEPSG